ncbi:meteorin-like protein [Carassius carassius]|uniref:meteorin-like protein n=1 Tax=Carassius carassius TaxID=217509 RepID=UPI00286857FD|nr:meteorin-like protein [Carassius carassius]
MVLFILLSALVLCACAQYSSDQCNWRGSLVYSHLVKRDVEQVYLRCAEGALEWLYPTGALVVTLRPNLPPAEGHLHTCLKPRPDSRGATLYVEQSGALRLLLTEEDQASGRVRCFSLQEGVLFVEASARRDISRTVTAFQYQLMSTQTPGDGSYSHTDYSALCCTLKPALTHASTPRLQCALLDTEACAHSRFYTETTHALLDTEACAHTRFYTRDYSALCWTLKPAVTRASHRDYSALLDTEACAHTRFYTETTARSAGH